MLEPRQEVISANGVIRSGPIGFLQLNNSGIERSMSQICAIRANQVTSEIVSEDNEKYAMFLIYFESSSTGRTWIVKRRYSELDRFRKLVLQHLHDYSNLAPRTYAAALKSYFPRKQGLLSLQKHVLHHRCKAILAFIRRVTAIMLNQEYMQCGSVARRGHSILRGFLGSRNVFSCDHRDYVRHLPVYQVELDPSLRKNVTKCGTLTTVPEDITLDLFQQTKDSTVSKRNEKENPEDGARVLSAVSTINIKSRLQKGFGLKLRAVKAA